MEVIYFKNPGVLVEEMPKEIIQKLLALSKKIEHKNYNKRLAGNIEKEFYFPEGAKVIRDFIFEMCNKYDETFDYLSTIRILTDDLPMVLLDDDVWINFQHKHEFNPIHDHSGIYSFVIWLQVPYTIEDELKESPGKNSNKPSAGMFEFIYTNVLGASVSNALPVDKKWEGKIAFFPSKLAHCVYPFYTSNEYRISVSGNIKLEARNERS